MAYVGVIFFANMGGGGGRNFHQKMFSSSEISYELSSEKLGPLFCGPQRLCWAHVFFLKRADHYSQPKKYKRYFQDDKGHISRKKFHNSDSLYLWSFLLEVCLSKGLFFLYIYICIHLWDFLR